MAAAPAENTQDKWVWRPRWPAGLSVGGRGHSLDTGRHRRRRPVAATKWTPPPHWFAVAVVLVLSSLVIKDARALGFFELQILEIENYRGQLATGECCGSSPSAPPSRAATNCIGAAQCNTLFRVCLREYQNRQPSSGGPQPSAAAQPASNAAAAVAVTANAPAGSAAQLHCSFGNTSSPVLGGNSFTLTDSDSSDSRGQLSLPFSFSWTRSFTFILHAMDYNNYTGSLSVIEEATYSGILLPGNEWKALSHLGRTARMAYRVRVQCDRFYYGQTCTKLCKPRDDRFGHYTCGDTDGRKECIPGWQGENCDKAVCKTGCHPVHGKCDYPGGCECRKGWQGELCDQCMTYPGCKHGYCNGTSWQCICDINWGGILCDQDLNYCGTHEPCLNGGTCKSTAPDRYTCTCPEGFSGPNCDVVLNPCATEPCLNGGKCTTTTITTSNNPAAALNPSAPASSPSFQPLQPKQFHCECQPGWTGSTCNTEIDECASMKPRCLNGGTCVDKLNDWACLCPDRWRGLQCEIDVDECESQQQRTNGNQATCGPNAVQCRTDNNNGTQCVCRKGWATNAVNNNGNVAFAPLGCPVNVDDCAAPGLCMNGGTCVDLVASYVCTCPVGFTGQRCQTPIDPCDSLAFANPCKNGGECVRSPGSSRPYSCICPLGYSGDECEINRDHCTPNPCRNGGQCLNTPDDYYCHCTVAADGSAWHGKNCTATRKKTGSPATSSSSSATTVRLPAVVVHQEDTFRDTEEYYYYNNGAQTCADSRVCLNGGTCVLAGSQGGGAAAGLGVGGRRNKPHTGAWYRCKCPEGYRGQHCESRQEDFPNQQHNGGKRPKVEYDYEEMVKSDGDDDDDDLADSNNNDDTQRATTCTASMLNKHWPAAGADQRCNECRCTAASEENLDDDDDDVDDTPTVRCSNLWCGPRDCMSYPCAANQVCLPLDDTVADVSSWKRCLRAPCAEEPNRHSGTGGYRHQKRFGRCVSNGDESVQSVWPSAARHCWPSNGGGDRQDNGCGTLSVTLDAKRLRRGTTTDQVCHNMRRLISLSWAADNGHGQDAATTLYVMCEPLAKTADELDSDHVSLRVSAAVAQQEAVKSSSSGGLVQRALTVLYRQLLNGTAAKIHGEQPVSSASLAAAVVRVQLTGRPPASTQYGPAESANDYQYYYWTGVACGSLTIIAACLLLRFGYQQWKKRNGGADCAASTAGKSNAAMSNRTSNSNNNLMLVQRQNEENLRRYSAVAANTNKLNAGGLNPGAGALSTSSLNCSRISIVHPLCQQPDTVASQQQQHQMMEIYDNKTGGVASGGGLDKSSLADDKTGGGLDGNQIAAAAAAAAVVKPATAMVGQVTAGSSPQHHQLHSAAIPLCKKTQNIEQQQHYNTTIL